MRLIVGLILLLTPVFASASEARTLVERLALDSLSELRIVRSSGDETHANYTLVAERGVRPVLGAVQRRLLAQGWTAHPNLHEASPSLTPGRGGLNLYATGGQSRFFVRADELLEVRAAPVGRSRLVRLQLMLIAEDMPE